MYCMKEFREEYVEYLVKQGDTLYNIAKVYGVNVEEIMRLNSLGSTVIYPNQVLLIPNMKENNSNIYETVKNDTINVISDKSGKMIEELKMYNDIYDLELVPGQKIVLKEKDKKYYTVTNGDTVFTIAKKTNTSIDDLIKYNEGNWLVPGNRIVIG